MQEKLYPGNFIPRVHGKEEVGDIQLAQISHEHCEALVNSYSIQFY